MGTAEPLQCTCRHNYSSRIYIQGLTAQQVAELLKLKRKIDLLGKELDGAGQHFDSNRKELEKSWKRLIAAGEDYIRHSQMLKNTNIPTINQNNLINSQLPWGWLRPPSTWERIAVLVLNLIFYPHLALPRCLAVRIFPSRVQQLPPG